MALKTGALSKSDFLAIWEGAADKGYTRPFEEAGDGQGFEAWSQFFVQMARVSTAIDITTQALYIMPFSGQTNPPASGAKNATVTLTISRTLRSNAPLFLKAGTVAVVEETTEPADDGPITAFTDRRYFLTQDAFFFPGDRGPLQIQAQAENPGYGYNNPLPDTLDFIEQPGVDFNNDQGAVTLSIAAAGPTAVTAQSLLIAAPKADMFVPQHVGQLVDFTAGANVGATAHIIGFIAPDPTHLLGSGVVLELLWTIRATTFSGAFVVGEQIEFKNSGVTVAWGKVVAFKNLGSEVHLAFDLQSGGSIAVASTIHAATSGATATIVQVTSFFNPTPEAPSGGIGGLSWKIPSWADDYGLLVTNAASPSGGFSAMLDEIGYERNLGRGPNEDDDTYRNRLHQIDDVVTPNAIKRTIARSWTHAATFLETETDWLGIYYDGGNEPPSATPGRAQDDAYDTDVILYTGTAAIPFFNGEPVVVEDSLFRQSATGYFGGETLTTFTLVRKTGGISVNPAPIHIRGVLSGGHFDVTTESIPTSVAARAHRTYLSYEQMRAFFWVEVPHLADGEFGCAYDVGNADAYDVGFYDGYPYLASTSYWRLWHAVDRVRAEGVGWELRRT